MHVYLTHRHVYYTIIYIVVIITVFSTLNLDILRCIYHSNSEHLNQGSCYLTHKTNFLNKPYIVSRIIIHIT